MYVRHLLLLLMTLCAVACSHHDEALPPAPAPVDGGITFGGHSGAWQDAPSSRCHGVGETTRAVETGLETLFTSFRVWGYKTTAQTEEGIPSSPQAVMEGYDVFYTANTAGQTASNTHDWEYVGHPHPLTGLDQTLKFWDYSATSYRFCAYAPADANPTVSTPPGESISFAFPFEYPPTTPFPCVSELWHSTPSAAAPSPRYGECVSLTFVPLLAKVRFRFSYPPKLNSITIRDIEFCDSRFAASPSTATTPLRGTLTATYPQVGTPASASPRLTWADAAENPTGFLVLTIPYEDEQDDIHILEPEAYGCWYYVPPYAIPATTPAVPSPPDAPHYEQGSYTIRATIDGNRTAASVPAEYMQWKPGCQYTYIFKITEAGEAITFSDLQVERWETVAASSNQGKGTEGW